MVSNSKKVIFYISFVGIILIVAGLVLSIKELMSEEDLLNMADDGVNNRVFFNLNGATEIDARYVKCKKGENGCSVTLPVAKRTEGYVLGYSDNMNDTKAKYKMNESITVNENMTLYVISYKENSLFINKGTIDYLEKETVTCKAFNTNSSCDVKIPRYNKVGYENKGYTVNAGAQAADFFPGKEYSIKGDVVIYPIYSTYSRHQVINIAKVMNYRESFIEIENGCTDNIAKRYIEYLDGISKNTPFLLLGNKITFMVDNTFNNIWGSSYVGMNYGPKSLRSVDIRCTENQSNDYYATMVHEMAHSWDFYYGLKTGENISSQSDVINLFSKYKNHSNRPFREYSYSSIYEFVADMMRYYYFKYYVPSGSFESSVYPSDIKKVLEKYICISKNDYQVESCN